MELTLFDEINENFIVIYQGRNSSLVKNWDTGKNELVLSDWCYPNRLFYSTRLDAEKTRDYLSGLTYCTDIEIIEFPDELHERFEGQELVHYLASHYCKKIKLNKLWKSS